MPAYLRQGGRCFRRGGTAAPAVSYRGPRVAALDYSGTVDTARTQLHAKYDLSIRNWSAVANYASGGTAYTFAQGLKALNPSTKQFFYALISQMNTTGGGTLYTQFNTAINNGGGTRNWWATTAGSTTQKTNYNNAAYPNVWEINQTSFVQADGAGRRWPEVAGDGFISTWAQMWSAGLIQGVMTDNVWYGPRADTVTLGSAATADYDLDGDNEPVDAYKHSTTAAVNSSFRQGYPNFWTRLKSGMPGFLISGNTEAMEGTSFQNVAALAELTGKMDYPLLEGFINENYSPDWFNSFSNLMNWYKTGVDNSVSGSTINLVSTRPTSQGASRTYRIVRYGLGVTLLNDGFFCPVNKDSAIIPVWYDDMDPAIANLGTRTGSVPTSANNSGVFAGKGLWTQTYQNGLVIVNPADNRGRYMGNATGFSLVRSSNVVTLTHSALGTAATHGRVVGDLVRIEACSDSSFNGIFTLTAVGTNTLTWAQTGANATPSVSAGWYATQATVDLTGQGYKRILTSNDAHNNYDGTLGSGTPVYTSQNDGSAVTTLKLWSGDAVILLPA